MWANAKEGVEFVGDHGGGPFDPLQRRHPRPESALGHPHTTHLHRVRLENTVELDRKFG